MIRKHPTSYTLIDWVFEIARIYLPEQYYPLLHVLPENPDLECFKKMGLLSSSFMPSSNEIREEVQEKELRKNGILKPVKIQSRVYFYTKTFSCCLSRERNKKLFYRSNYAYGRMSRSVLDSNFIGKFTGGRIYSYRSE